MKVTGTRGATDPNRAMTFARFGYRLLDPDIKRRAVQA